MTSALASVAAALVGLWGVAHAVPTRAVAAGFGDISTDNRRVLVQEWLAEAVTMWALAGLVLGVTFWGDAATSTLVYRIVAGALLALALLTALTGARTPVVWFKICPILLTASAGLLLTAGALA